jgi:hypothetical protein
MTAETPKQHPDVMRCTDCGTTLDVVRQDNRTLAVACNCDELRSIKVATALPEGWSA